MLVEAWAADHLVRNALPHEYVLEHTALRIRAVDDGDLARAVTLLDPRGDLRGDEARLPVLVLGLDDTDGLAFAEVGPEILLLALAVVRDDLVRRLQDRVRRAVVLLERDHLRVREVALELHDVADVGAAERVDALIGVPDGHDVFGHAGQELEEHVLGVVRVLVFVDQDVGEPVLQFLQHIGVIAEGMGRAEQQVVEIQRVVGVQ